MANLAHSSTTSITVNGTPREMKVSTSIDDVTVVDHKTVVVDDSGATIYDFSAAPITDFDLFKIVNRGAADVTLKLVSTAKDASFLLPTDLEFQMPKNGLDTDAAGSITDLTSIVVTGTVATEEVEVYLVKV